MHSVSLWMLVCIFNKEFLYLLAKVIEGELG